MLIPRYLRTTRVKWFWYHAIWQTLVTGIVLLVGIGYGLRAAERQVKAGTTKHFNDPHKVCSNPFPLLVAYIPLYIESWACHPNTLRYPSLSWSSCSQR